MACSNCFAKPETAPSTYTVIAILLFYSVKVVKFTVEVKDVKQFCEVTHGYVAKLLIELLSCFKAICVCKDVEATVNDAAAALATATSAAIYTVVIAVALAAISIYNSVSDACKIDVVT